MSPHNDEGLTQAGLQDIPGPALQESLSDLLARNSAVCDAEYGTRVDDGALVLHFFPPGYGADMTTDWKDWYAFRDRLEQAMLSHFDALAIDAGYAGELHSFYVIVSPAPQVPDRTALIESFFAALEAEARTASESSP